MEKSILTANLEPKEGVLYQADPIALEVDDKKLIAILDKPIKDSHTFFEKEYDLYKRRKKNETYLFGKEIKELEKENRLRDYESRFLYNILYEIEASIKPVSMSRLPDMIVVPGNETPQQQKSAKDLTRVIDSDIKSRQNRIALGMAGKHLPVYFIAIIKCIWLPEKNDYMFKIVHPDYIEVPHTCQTNNVDDMWFIAETLPITVQECFIRFPDKKEELRKELEQEGKMAKYDGDIKDKDLATIIKIKEIWFDKKVPKKEEGKEKSFEVINGVIWKFKDCILEKKKNPNYDWEGTDKVYTYDDPSDESTKREVKEEDYMMSMMQGTEMYTQTEKFFRNYFECPRKPYFFFGYDQWGKVPYDETSRIEQNIPNQDELNKAGKRIVEKLRKRKINVWSKKGGITAKHIQELLDSGEEQDMLVDGEIRDAHLSIEPEQPTAQEFRFIDESKDRMYALAGATAIRGEQQSDVATTNQIAREADFTRADDLVEDTINAASEWMSDWSLQMIKLRYDEYKFKRVAGQDGNQLRVKLRFDMVEDGMEVIMKSSGTDKLKTKNQAMDMAKLGKIDILSFLEDLGVSDPKGRTKRLLTLEANPQMYLAQFVEELGNNPAQLAMTLNGQMPPSATPEMMQGMPQQPMQQSVQQPSPQNTGAMPATPPMQGGMGMV